MKIFLRAFLCRFFVCNKKLSNVLDSSSAKSLGITIFWLNEVVNDLESRFSPDNIPVIKGFYCIPSLMMKKPSEWKMNVKEAVLFPSYCILY